MSSVLSPQSAKARPNVLTVKKVDVGSLYGAAIAILSSTMEMILISTLQQLIKTWGKVLYYIDAPNWGIRLVLLYKAHAI